MGKKRDNVYNKWKTTKAKIPRTTQWRKTKKENKFDGGFSKFPSERENNGERTFLKNEYEETDIRTQPRMDSSPDPWRQADSHLCDLIYKEAQITVIESILSILHLSNKNNLTSAALCDIIDIIRLHTPKGVHVEHLQSLYYLKKVFGIQNGGSLKFHHMCEKCNHLFEDETTDTCPFESCQNHPRYKDDKRTPRAFFIEVDVAQQIRDFFREEEFLHDIDTSYRNQNLNHNDGGLNDVCDGQLYKEKITGIRIDGNMYNLSVTWHLDGASVFKSSNIEIWPFQGVINELPPSKRFSKQRVLLMGLWFGQGKPCLPTYMRPLATTLNRFQTSGIKVNASGKEAVCRIIPLMFTMDLPAMAMAKDIVQFNGEFGCGMCEEPGVTVQSGRGYARAFPFPDNVQNIQRRSKERMLQQAAEATSTNKKVKGVKGFSPLLLIENFDPGTQVVVDYLHGVCIGVMKDLFAYWFDTKYKGEPYWIGDKVEDIDIQLLQIRPPECITRTPRSIQHERSNFKASEYRNFLLFYGTHVLHQILPPEFYLHFIMLSRGVYLITKSSISAKELVEAETLLLQFYSLMSAYYGERSCRLNHHNTGLHLVECVKAAGPLWSFSTFGFESFCGDYIRMIHGTQHIALQIVAAFQSVQKLRLSARLLKISNKEIEDFIFGTKRGKEELQHGYQRFGAGSRSQLGPTYQAALREFMPVMEGANPSVLLYKKIEGRGTSYTTLQPGKSNKREDFVVSYVKGTIFKFGIIEMFATIPWREEAIHVAFISPFECCEDHHWFLGISDSSLAEHGLSRDIMMDQTIPVTHTQLNQDAVPVSALREKLLFLPLDYNYKRGVLMKFPNLFEHD